MQYYTIKEFHYLVFKSSAVDFDKDFLLRNIGKECVITPNGWNDIPVQWAAKHGYLEVVKYLHKKGADITDCNNCAIKWAAEYGYLEVVKYLHKKGANITSNGNYTIRWAAENGHLEVVKYLHENGIGITAYDNYAIRSATRRGHLEVVKYLHENGADITARDNYAIKWAVEKSHSEIVKYILDTFLLSKETVTKILDNQRNYNENKEVLELLQNYGQFSNTKAIK